MTPSGIESATFRFVAQHLNHCASAVPLSLLRFHLHICDYGNQSHKVHCIYSCIKAAWLQRIPF